MRPTSDKARQAIFNILAHNEFGIGFALDGARAADLFAGTGALGLEAISHGAAYCLFVDDSAESRALIRANVEAFERAVDAVAEVSGRLLDELVTNAPPKDREVEAAKARARSAQRFAA